MPLFIEILCPTNGLLLASFEINFHYYYRLPNGIEYPLKVAYAWCHQCEHFVECERLDSIEALELQIEKSESVRERDYWTAILEWRKQRKTPPRCLTCGSFFAIHILPDSEAIEHPDGNCLVKVGGILHECNSGRQLDACFFDAEGRLIERIPESDLTRQEIDDWMRTVAAKHGNLPDTPVEDR